MGQHHIRGLAKNNTSGVRKFKIDQAPRYNIKLFSMLNSAEREIYPAHKW